MLGGIFKLIFSFTILFLFITLFWQVSIVEALPTLGANEHTVQSNDDTSSLLSTSNSHTGGNIVKRSLHNIIDQQLLIDNSLSSPSARLNAKKKFFHFNHIKSSPNLFQSTGTYKKNLRAAKRIKAALDNRLKRFRMLDQDEFQEMLTSLSQQTNDEQSKIANGMDTIGGMQLANYWSAI